MRACNGLFSILIVLIYVVPGFPERSFSLGGRAQAIKPLERATRDTYPANVTRLSLSQNVVFINCDATEARCSENREKIDVRTTAVDPENDTLLYKYKISGGRIIGEGENVVWELSNAEPGEYTITAGVDDGCGICGETRTRVVYVVECPNVRGEGYPAGAVTGVAVQRGEVFEACSMFDKKTRYSCTVGESLIGVATHATVEDENRAIYKYEVSGGEIVGNGADVEWDLTKAGPGTYVVTASVDVGYGFCANAKSTTVKVTECSRCHKRSKKTKTERK